MDGELQNFYEYLQVRFAEESISFCITGGQACMVHQLALFTKDLDLVIARQAPDKLIRLLADTPFGNAPCRYRIGLGAPLAAPWVEGGWISHFQWLRGGKRNARLDIFVCPPRLPREPLVQGNVMDWHRLAEIKKTRRDKDWDFVTALGERLLENDDERGFLHLFSGESLRAALRNRAPSTRLQEIRPLLKLALAEPDTIDSALVLERRFWMTLDALRIRIFRDAFRPFYRAVSKRQELQGAPLSEQHEKQIRTARECLDPDPINTYGADQLVETAVSEAGHGFSADLSVVLPPLVTLGYIGNESL
jgi:hypothetical protein